MQTVTRPKPLLFSVLLLAVAASTSLAQSFTVGVFDPQRVSGETVEGRRVQTELAALRDTKQQEITEKEQAIQLMQEQLSQQALSLSPDKRGSLELDIQRKIAELTTLKEIGSKVLQLEVAAAQAKFNDKLIRVVTQFGREEGFDILLDRSLVAWSAESVDVTTAMVDLFDRVYAPGGG